MEGFAAPSSNVCTLSGRACRHRQFCTSDFTKHEPSLSIQGHTQQCHQCSMRAMTQVSGIVSCMGLTGPKQLTMSVACMAALFPVPAELNIRIAGAPHVYSHSQKAIRHRPAAVVSQAQTSKQVSQAGKAGRRPAPPPVSLCRPYTSPPNVCQEHSPYRVASISTRSARNCNWTA